MMLTIFMIPLLLTSFGLLYLYYNHCHKWVADGISVGFLEGSLDGSKDGDKDEPTLGVGLD